MLRAVGWRGGGWENPEEGVGRVGRIGWGRRARAHPPVRGLVEDSVVVKDPALWPEPLAPKPAVDPDGECCGDTGGVWPRRPEGWRWAGKENAWKGCEG